VKKGYTDQYLIADVSGKHDGVPAVAMLDVLIEAAENWIDKYTQRAWLVSSVTAELHTLTTWPPTSYSHYRTWGGSDWWDWSNSNRRDAIITLNVAPVTAITAVRARGLYVGAPITTLPATDYEIMDPNLGQLLIAATYFAQRLSIDYTCNTPVPADIKYAASLLVSYWVGLMISATGAAASLGIKSYSIGQDLTVEFQDTGTRLKLDAPPNVIFIANQYKNVLIGF